MSSIARQITELPIEQEMTTSYVRYAMSVIVGRAFPDVRDGLKPVHRRILYAMFDEGNRPDSRRVKCGAVVGEVLKKYHPHGDQAVYDTLVRMAQDFSLRYPLIDGQGNFGSMDGDPPAAYRYTEARLAPIATELLRDIDQETVDFTANYDESTTEPTVLPSVFPHLLVNGSQGIGVGMATNIPPHNLGEVCDAVSYLIDHPDATIDQLMKIVPGPDFPTAGLILGTKGIREAYATGRGSITLQARAVIEPMERGQNAILITELPYQQNKAVLIEQIARLVREKKMPEGISEIRDESDRTGLRIVIELRRDTNPHVILNHLYKHTSLRQTFGIINLAIVDGAPRILTLKEMLEYFIKHRQDVITRRTKFQLKKAQARAHILEGFRIILKHLDDVVALIRASKNRDDARQGLRARYGLSDEQANAILNMQLGQLTQLDQQRIQDEYADLLKEIEMLEGILADPRRVLHLIKEDMRRIKREYGDERRTQIRPEEAADIKIEDLIAQEDMVITITRDGYIKRLPVDTYRTQGRGGKGMIGLTKKEEDAVQHLFIANTHSQILFFTNKGRVYQLRAFEVPAASRQARGTPIINLVQLEPGEKITATIPVRDFKQKGYLFMTTKLGTVKKTPLEEFDTRYSKGLIAITLEDKDELRWVEWTDGKREILLGTHNGMSIRFPESDVRAMGRPAAGVIGMRLSRGDYIIGMDVVKKGHDLLVVSEQGYGKRTDIDEYRLQSRGGSGVLTMKITEKNGPVVDLRVVHPEDELLLITQRGVVIRQKVSDISQVGRNTQGVRLIRLDERDKVSAVARIVREQEE